MLFTIMKVSGPRLRRGLLTLLCIGIGAFQIRSTLETFEFLDSAQRFPRYPASISFTDLRVQRIRPEAEAAGLRRGDVIQSVDGHALRGLADFHAPLRSHQPGDLVTLGVLRDGQPLTLTVPLATPRESAARQGPPPGAPKAARKGASPVPTSAAFRRVEGAERVLLIYTGVFTIWFSFILGFFVAFRRPGDLMAWLLLGFLLGFAQMSTGERVFTVFWEPPWCYAGALYLGLASSAWPAFLFWFGLYFPDPRSARRFLGWLGLPLGIIIVGGALVRAVSSLLVLIDFRAAQLLLPLGEFIGGYIFWPISLAIGLFFANIGYKMGTGAAPDARRRMRLIMWGGNFSLTPIFFLLLAARLWTGGDIAAFPAYIWIPPLFLLALFPLVLAYVILVERAMDVGVVVREGLQYALASRGVIVLRTLFIVGLVLVTFLVGQDTELSAARRLQYIAFCVAGVGLIQRFAERLSRWVDRRFFREQVEAERVLADLAAEARGITDPAVLTETVRSRIQTALHATDVRLVRNGRPQAELLLPLDNGNRHYGWLALGPKKGEQAYSRADRRLLETVAAQTALALDNHRLAEEAAAEMVQRAGLERELAIAREVQQRLFPQTPPSLPGFEIAGRCRPALSVGGDYFDYGLLDDGALFAAVGDVSGKGIPAALVMASLQAALRGLLFGGAAQLTELLARLNTLIYESTARNRFATLFLCRYEPATRTLGYCSAGHPGAILVRASGDTVHLGQPGFALGLIRQAAYESGAVSLTPGDTVILFSDGFSEAMDPQREEFGEPRLAQAASLLRTRPAEGIVEALFIETDRFAATAEQHDDMTLVVLKFSPDPVLA
jgi:sigma-B regulation protein RsbU (phosphoserine phosphatase)